MTELLTQFHFLRPYWLLALIPCLLVLSLIWRQRKEQGSWTKVIAPALLKHLIQGVEARQSRKTISTTRYWLGLLVALLWLGLHGKRFLHQ